MTGVLPCSPLSRPAAALALASSLLAASCGGGGSSAAAPAPAPTPTPTPTAPALASPGMRMATAGTGAVSIVIANTGGDVTGCSAPGAGAATARLPAGLAVGVAESGGKMTCAVTGTVEAAAEAGTYTVVITAAGAGGPATATVTIVVRPRPPALADATVPGALELGARLAMPIRLANSGGDVAAGGCSVSPALPMGLDLARVEPAGAAATCEISGAPSEAAASSTYTVTGANAGGMGTAAVTLAVAAAQTEAPAISNPTETPTFTVGFPIAPLRFINTGGDVAAGGCDDGGALPQGLAVRRVDPDESEATCEIFGTPRAAADSASYTITATNSVGPGTATITFAVAAAAVAATAPSLAGVSNATLTAGVRGSIDIPNSGGAVDPNGCALSSGALPTGLVVAAAVPAGGGTPGCSIAGVAGAAAAAALVEVTGTNTHGDSTASVMFTVLPRPPALADIADPRAVLAGNTIDPITFTNTGGGEIGGCAASPDLPTGLAAGPTDDKSSCQITGMPEAEAAGMAYTVTASNAGGVGAGTVTLAVAPALAAPASAAASATGAGELTLSWAASPGATHYRVLRGDTAVRADAAEITAAGGLAATTLTDGGLSVGTAYHYWVLSCNAIGCEQAGAAVTATAPAEASAPSIEPIAIPGGEPLYRYEIGRAYPEGRSISFANSGATITGCTVAEDDLPVGMSIVTGTCEITGAPSGLEAALTSHTVTATSAMGESTAMIQIEAYHHSPPRLAAPTSGRIALAGGQTTGLPIVVPNTGGIVTECRTVSGARDPDDIERYNLSVSRRDDGSGCQLGLANPSSGITPNRLDRDFQVEAVNAAGVSQAFVNISVGGVTAPSALAVDGGATDFSFAANSAITPITFTATGDGHCAASGTGGAALPAGLALDLASCAISGAPTEVVAQTNYTLTLSRGSDSASEEITITVTDAAPVLEASPSAGLFQGIPDSLPLVVAATAGVPTSCTASATTASQGTLAEHNLFIYATGAGCAIDSLDGQGPAPSNDGSAYTLGYEISASGAAGSTTSASALTLEISPRLPVVVGNGSFHTCAINAAGRLYCTGRGGPALGFEDRGTFENLTRFAKVGDTGGWRDLSSGDDFSCAITASGELHCWGNGGHGRLGNDSLRSEDAPQRAGTRADWASVSAYTAHACATTTSGQLHCWGAGQWGRLGQQGDTNDKSTPQRVGTGSDWASVSAGTAHTCATTTSGQLHCWGFGSNGRLGNGATSSEGSLQHIGAGTDWASVSAGNSHTCATTTSGQLHCWGLNDKGQLGNNSLNEARTPQRIGTGTDWAQVSAGNSHTCATTTSGQLHCWGSRTNGRLGLGSLSEDQLTPAQVTGADMALGSGWLSVSAVYNSTCAIRRDGRHAELWCWGLASLGIIGDGDDSIHSVDTPLQIPLP